jgi:hypothetical protein
VVTNLTLTELDDLVTEGLPSLDYWSIDDEAYHLIFWRDMLLVLEVHPANGGWDTSLTKREC